MDTTPPIFLIKKSDYFRVLKDIKTENNVYA